MPAVRPLPVRPLSHVVRACNRTARRVPSAPGLGARRYPLLPLAAALVTGAASAASCYNQMPRLKLPSASPSMPACWPVARFTKTRLGWSKAKLSIPLRGPKASATLKVIAGRGAVPGLSPPWKCWSKASRSLSTCCTAEWRPPPAKRMLTVHTQPAIEAELLDVTANSHFGMGLFQSSRSRQ